MIDASVAFAYVLVFVVSVRYVEAHHQMSHPRGRRVHITRPITDLLQESTAGRCCGCGVVGIG